MRYRSELSETKRFQLASQYLQQVEGAMAELGDTGLSAKLDGFFASLNSISSNPSDFTMRADLLAQAKIWQVHSILAGKICLQYRTI